MLETRADVKKLKQIFLKRGVGFVYKLKALCLLPLAQYMRY